MTAARCSHTFGKCAIQLKCGLDFRLEGGICLDGINLDIVGILSKGLRKAIADEMQRPAAHANVSMG